MRLKSLIAVGFGTLLLISSITFARSGSTTNSTPEPNASYVCPETSVELPCPNCCPLNK